MQGIRNPMDDALASFWNENARRAPFFAFAPGLAAGGFPAGALFPVIAPFNNKLPPISFIHGQGPLLDTSALTVPNKLAAPAQAPPQLVVPGMPISTLNSVQSQGAPALPALDHDVEEKGSKPRRKYTACRRTVRAWTEEEHSKFLEGLEKFRTADTQAVKENGELSVGLGPGIAEVISVFIGTRSVTQVRSHAQKYFQRQRREQAKAASSE
mmetsp:Transcript_12298/g.25297  ORF Transcript_12298/g.25297 Transcript_12298/m.25297 type:complete len:212 (+) Transcript_12298:53-688(+)